MKKKLLFILLGLLIINFNSCKTEDKTLFCAEILILQKLDFNYFDENGDELLFGNSPEYDVENLFIYKESGGKKQQINYDINEEERSVSIFLDQVPDGLFFIELEPNVVDEIRFEGIIDETRLPCKEYKIVKLFQNEIEVNANNESSIWELKK